jgi:hypothetical protein
LKQSDSQSTCQCISNFHSSLFAVFLLVFNDRANLRSWPLTTQWGDSLAKHGRNPHELGPRLCRRPAAVRSIIRGRFGIPQLDSTLDYLVNRG